MLIDVELGVLHKRPKITSINDAWHPLVIPTALDSNDSVFDISRGWKGLERTGIADPERSRFSREQRPAASASPAAQFELGSNTLPGDRQIRQSRKSELIRCECVNAIRLVRPLGNRWR